MNYLENSLTPTNAETIITGWSYAGSEATFTECKFRTDTQDGFCQCNSDGGYHPWAADYSASPYTYAKLDSEDSPCVYAAYKPGFDKESVVTAYTSGAFVGGSADECWDDDLTTV